MTNQDWSVFILAWVGFLSSFVLGLIAGSNRPKDGATLKRAYDEGFNAGLMWIGKDK